MTTHQGNCHTCESHQTLVLAITVQDADVDIARGVLAVIRSGLAADFAEGDPVFACTWRGPFTVAGEDLTLFEAISDANEGRFEFDKDEPCIIRNKAMLAGARALVAAAS